MSEGSFNLRKWNSSSPQLMEKISQLEQAGKGDHTMPQTYSETQSKEAKILGVSWNTQSDELSFCLSDLVQYAANLPMTKRSVLRVTASIFDPLGLLAPFVIKLKILFQQLCNNQLHWDDNLQGELLLKWKTVLREFESLNKVTVPRCLFMIDKNLVDVQLHGFSDASELAYAAVLYLRSIYDDGSVEVRVIAAKMRVTPLKNNLYLD